MTKLKMIPTAVVLAVVLVGVWMFQPFGVHPRGTDVDGGKKEVVVAITFEPSPRTGGPIRPGSKLSDLVMVQVFVGKSYSSPKRTLRESGWNETYRPPKGTRIDVRAEQFGGGKLTCIIAQKGKKPKTDTKPGGPIVVNCIDIVI